MLEVADIKKEKAPVGAFFVIVILQISRKFVSFHCIVTMLLCVLCQELWISPREWRRHGQKLLRERAPFPWA